jgi:hypothetical protein
MYALLALAAFFCPLALAWYLLQRGDRHGAERARRRRSRRH